MIFFVLQVFQSLIMLYIKKVVIIVISIILLMFITKFILSNAFIKSMDMLRVADLICCNIIEILFQCILTIQLMFTYAFSILNEGHIYH